MDSPRPDDRFWEVVLIRKRSRFMQFLTQLGVAATGLWITELLYRNTKIYSSTFTLVTSILVVLSGEALLGLAFTFALVIISDYYYLPPVGSIFDTRESFEHLVIIGVTTVAVALLVNSLREAYRSSVATKQEASRAKHDAEEAANAMERVLALVSHDVRNPIAAVKVTAQMILRHPEKPEKNQQMIGRIIGDLDRVDGMIQTLLDISRVRAGQAIPLELAYCDLREIASRTAEDLALVIGDRVRFTGSEPIFGLWSKEGMRRALENLAGNAVKYGAPDTPIELRLRREGNLAVLSVHNSGKPIPAEEQGRLFDAFQRGTDDSRKKRGWGLGLALVKGIAEAHAGAARVSSAEGAGTTFSLDLPIRADDPASKQD